MYSKGQLLLVDTNVIIEAHRSGCWNSIMKFFHLETVEKCCEEAATGDKRRKDYVEVNMNDFRYNVKVHPVTSLQVATLATTLESMDGIDPGERDLLAHALGRTDGWIISSPDKKAVWAGNALGFLGKFVSLEEAADLSGVKPSLRYNYTKKWLSGIRSEILLGGMV